MDKKNSMHFFDSLKIEDKWLLTIIDSVPYVEGRIRLQKLGILSFYKVLNKAEFFDDWRPDNYGGFSPRLATSLVRLQEYDCIQSHSIVIEYENTVDRYALTEQGKRLVKDFAKRHALKLKEIRTITSHYFQLPLMSLLKDVYQKYPELTVNSKISADVNKAIAENDLHLNSIYDLLQDRRLDTGTPIIASRQHVFGDDDFREKLARSIGLEKSPDLDPRAFDRIQGILSDKIDTEHFDSEELVREVRGC